MRILHFYKDYFPDSTGGIEEVIRQICVGTGRIGATSEVLTLTTSDQLAPIAFEGHTIYRVHRDLNIASTGIALAAFGELKRRAAQADIVHYHFPWPFMDLAHFAAGINKPTVVTYHSDIVRQKMLLRLYTPLKRRFLQSVDTIVATSPNYLATSTVLERYRDKTRTITYGLDKSIYPSADAALLAKWRAVVGEKFFLFVGVLRYYKGLHILLDAVADLDYPVVIVGAGPSEVELKAHAVRLGLTHVLFLGFLDDIDKVALLTLCYAMVFPSHLRSEAFGISLLEGAMYGKPLISSEIGTGTSYINVHDETGLVVPPSDAPALRQAMVTLWNNPQQAQVMGLRAFERYNTLFTAERMASNYMALYRELMARHADQARL
ncbi:glycosyltransferase family 4 protein [Massilia sp. PWRC2]|uniref:glycosyltransferase family 4 protein n=1 Tax=Massilia sp. PWRC2 TaxID=2804626 RepID=UPI003CE7B95D